MKDLRGKKAVVTGGGSGIGRGIALALAAEGMDVVIADLDAETAATVADEAHACGVEAIAFDVDVTDASSLATLADRAYQRLGRCDLLSNNAGVAFQSKLEAASEQDWQWVMSVNLHGLVKACAAFVPRMRGQGGAAHIVNTASLAGLIPIDFLDIGIYTASKYAAVAFSETLHAELSPAGIDVSVLCPGMVRTNLGTTSARHRPQRYGGPMAEPEDEVPTDLEAMMMEPEEVGRIVVRAVRENRRYIVTHPEARALVEQRFHAILADFDAAARTRGPGE
jgi:NAD(P)-dependent dehydrogenase (short-subunit alcohol dehydrogenase family)